MWAFATSPHGLGLSSESFWCLRTTEYQALRRAYEAPLKRWAFEQATFHNANFETKGAPWVPDDFLGQGNRQERIAQAARDKAETDLLNFELGRIQQGKTTSVPFWALKDWDGTVSEDKRKVLVPEMRPQYDKPQDEMLAMAKRFLGDNRYEAREKVTNAG